VSLTRIQLATTLWRDHMYPPLSILLEHNDYCSGSMLSSRRTLLRWDWNLVSRQVDIVAYNLLSCSQLSVIVLSSIHKIKHTVPQPSLKDLWSDVHLHYHTQWLSFAMDMDSFDQAKAQQNLRTLQRSRSASKYQGAGHHRGILQEGLSIWKWHRSCTKLKLVETCRCPLTK